MAQSDYRKGRSFMARKNNVRILSGCCIFVFTVMFLSICAHAKIEVSVETFTISGTIDGVEGVVLSGFPDQEVVTNSNGEYYATVEYDWSGTVTPKKDGYTFSPSSRPYRNIDEDQVNQDFKATAITYTLSVKVGNMEGVVLNGLPGNPTTNATGSYSGVLPYGWTGTVEPLKDGFEFNPPTMDIDSLKQPKSLNFTASAVKIDISGNVGVGGVEMTGLPGKVISGADGSYSVTVEYNYSGTVTPKKEGYTFEPAEHTFQGLTYDQTQDFTSKAQQFTISGTVGMPGVLMDGFPDEVITDPSGSYSVLVDFDFTGTITPTLEGYSFKPGTMTYTQVRADKLNQDYKGSVRTYVIKGRTGISGVKMTGLPGNPVTTGPEGSYSVTVEHNWSGIVTPEKEGYGFEPSDNTYSGVAQDYTNEIYIASPKEYEISGNVGEPGVILRGFPGKQIESDSSGTYLATVPHGWSGKVTPQKVGYTFETQSIDFTNVTDNIYGKDFTAKLITYTISGTITTDKNKPVEGIAVSFGALGEAITDAQGRYTFDVPHGWTGGILPDTEKEGYSFIPPTVIQDKPLTKNLINQNFKAKIQMFKIFNVLEYSGKAIQGVQVTANPGNIVTQSNSKGEFTIEVPYGWTGEYTLFKKGIIFTPTTVSFENVTTDYMYGERVYPEDTPSGGATSGGTTSGGTTSGGTTSGGTTSGGTTSGGTTSGGTTSGGTTSGGTTSGGTTSGGTTSGGATSSGESEAMAQLRAQIAAMQEAMNNNNQPPAVTPGNEGAILVTETFAGDDLMTALEQISSEYGISIFYDSAVAGLVTCKLDRVPLEKALEMILASTPYFVTKIEGAYPYYLVAEVKVTNENGKWHMMTKTEVIQTDYIRARDVLQSLSPASRNFAMAPEDPNGHKITITAPALVLESIKRDIKAMDIKPYLVLLEARIVAMEKGDLLNLGVEWGWPTVTGGIYANDNRGVSIGDAFDLAGKTAWGFQMGYTPDAGFTNALEAVLNAMKVNNQAKVIAKPAVLTQDGSIADIRVVREDYYMLYAAETTNNYYSRQEMEKITTGTVLSITPHISDSADIVLEVAVEVSDTIPQSNDSGLPSVTRRTARSRVRVYDGGTVAIAGLSEDRQMKTIKAVPVLSSIPLVGELFKNNHHNNNNREVAIFITASIAKETSQINQSNQQQVGFTNTTISASAPSPMSADMYRVEPDNTNNRTRRTASAFDNNTSMSQEDMFTGFSNTDNLTNGSRRTSAPASLSPQDAFNRQLESSLATQGGRSGRSQY